MSAHCYFYPVLSESVERSRDNFASSLVLRARVILIQRHFRLIRGEEEGEELMYDPMKRV